MKLKYYLRGAGVGVIVATLVLMIAYAFTKDNTPQMTDAQIIARAKELGMVSLELEETKELLNDDEAAPDNNEEVETEPTTSEDPQTVDEFIEAEKNKPDESVSSVSYVPFTVSGGQGSLEVAKNLQTAGFIKNAEKFNNYIIAAGIDSYIQPGTFYIKEGISEEDLAVLLVTKQDERITTPKEINE